LAGSFAAQESEAWVDVEILSDDIYEVHDLVVRTQDGEIGEIEGDPSCVGSGAGSFV